MESSERMMNALEDFAKMDEFKDLHKQFNTIIKDYHVKRDEQGVRSEETKKEVEKKVGQVMERYSR